MTERQPTRIAFLRERIEAARSAGGPTSDVPFRQQVLDLPRIQIPIAFPLYNIGSGRTHRAQAGYIEEHSLPTEFFADPESEDAQLAQHEILLAMVDEEQLKADLQDKEQRRPLVLSYDGFIVDGNRRTAALRELREVEQLSAIVLPADALAGDLYETELELQMATDTKADYNWVDEALHVRYGVVTLGEPMDAIARRMNQPQGDIQDMLARLALVDLYLGWLGQPERYHRVGAEDEQSFRELRARERRSGFQTLSEPHQHAVRNAVFAVIRNPGGGYKDVRQVADCTITQLAEVAQRLREEPLPQDALERLEQPLDRRWSTPPVVDTLLGELAGAEGGEPLPAGLELLNIIESAPETDEVGDALIRVGVDLAELGREQRDQAQPLRKLERALKAMRDVNITSDTPGRSDIARTLAAIGERAEDLARQIDVMISGQPD
jgi:hypothetical protein